MTFPQRQPAYRRWSWEFNFDLEQLYLASKAAREATDRERDRLERGWTNLENEVAAGRASFTGEDEDGQIVYDLGDHVGEILSDIESVLRIVREAFTISLHHFWERQLKQLMKAKDYSE